MKICGRRRIARASLFYKISRMLERRSNSKLVNSSSRHVWPINIYWIASLVEQNLLFFCTFLKQNFRAQVEEQNNYLSPTILSFKSRDIGYLLRLMRGPQKITVLVVLRTEAGVLSSLQFRPKGCWFLLFYNALSYCAMIVKPFRTNRFVAISQPPCSPDIVPADLFPLSETTRKRKSS